MEWYIIYIIFMELSDFQTTKLYFHIKAKIFLSWPGLEPWPLLRRNCERVWGAGRSREGDGREHEWGRRHTHGHDVIATSTLMNPSIVSHLKLKFKSIRTIISSQGILKMLSVVLVRIMSLDGKVSATIVNLRNMANDIGNVTKAQNEMLNRWLA